jgi:hypothetical protein
MKGRFKSHRGIQVVINIMHYYKKSTYQNLSVDLWQCFMSALAPVVKVPWLNLSLKLDHIEDNDGGSTTMLPEVILNPRSNNNS